MKKKLQNSTSLYSAIKDEDVLNEARCGDYASLSYILKRYNYFIKSKTRKYFLIGGDYEDVFQEGMLGLYKAIMDYDYGKETSFKVFAELCIERQIITAVNTHNRKKHIPLNYYISIDRPVYENDSGSALVNMVTEGERSDPEWIYILEEELREIEQVMESILTKLEHNVLELYKEGNSYKEIALFLNKEEKSIDNALQRIRAKAQNHKQLKNRGLK